MQSVMFWRAVLACCMVWITYVSGQAPCSLNDVPLQANFNITQFLGTWYEVTWVSPTFEDSGNLWSNYYHSYSADNFGVVTGYYSGKDPNTGTCYFGGLVNLKTKDHPAKMQQYNENKKRFIDYWVVETDYSNYAMVYSCLQRAANNATTCNTARSWLWGRSTSGMPQATLDKANNTFRNLCMNMTLLYTTDFSGENCDPPTQTSGSLPRVGMDNTTIVLLFFMAFLALSKHAC